MKMIQKMRNARQNKKGFTLTEMIVVLVIIVILIALLVPTLVGYIDKAKEKSVMAEGKMVLTAAQTIISEKYAKNETTGATYTVTASSNSGIEKEIRDLAELTGTGSAEITITNNKVTKIVYTNGGKQATYIADGAAGEGENVGWTVGAPTTE